MRKILSLALVFILVLVTLTSCDVLNKFLNKGEDTTTQTPEETTAPASTYDIDRAAAFFDNLYKEDYSPTKDAETGETKLPVTQADFTVVAQIVIDGLTYTVEWTVDSDKVTVSEAEGGFITINVDEESPEEVKYTLSATIKDGNGKTAARSYELIVPEYVLWSHEEYMNAKEGDAVVIKGVVVAMNSASAGNKRNHLFLADLQTNGGYYSYQMEVDPVELGIEIGMTVEVSGPATPYTSGGFTMPEIKGGTARIIDTTKQNIAPIDVTAEFVAGDSLVQYVGRPVTIKGVEIGEQVLGGSSDYLWFKKDDKSAYLRTYLTDLNYSLLSKDENGTPVSAAKTQIEADHLAHFGYQADVTGIVVYYGTQVYLMPISADCFVYGQKIEKTPEQKVADVLDALKIATSFSADEVVELPASVYPEVVLTWASSNTEVIAIADGKMTVTVPETAVEVTVTITATCGEKSDSKEITVKLSKSATPIADIIELGLSKEQNTYTEGKYLVAGIITEVYNEQYGNMRITDELGNILTIYGTYGADGVNRYDALESKPVAGDYVVILGVVGQYNGTAQIKNGWILSYTTPTSVADAIALGASKEHNTYTEEKHVVTGVITEVYNTTYGNMYITDAEGNVLTIYGTYSADGSVRYDAMEVKPVAGDTVTIYGIVGQYNGTAQIKNGWIVAHTAATSETPETPEVPATLAEQIAEAQKLANGAYLSYESTMTGTVVGTPQESTYTAGTWKLSLTDGTHTITLYYVPVTGTPTEGCTITVTGKLTAYNGSAQFDSTATAKVEGGASTPEETTPEVTTPEETTPDPDTPATPAEPAPEAGTVKVVMADLGWENGTLYESATLNSYISASATGTPVGTYSLNTGKYYNTGKGWRIYQNENPALTITAAEGKTIVSVKITYTVDKTGVLTLNGNNVDSDAVVDVNANSITFSVGNTGTATNGQVRISAIEVVYA